MSEWQSFFVAAGIPAGIASRYAISFEENRITRGMLPELDKSTLVELGIKAIGDQLAILRRIKDSGSSLTKGITKPVHTPIRGPDDPAANTILGASEARKGRPPPDRHEIYHVKMPSGSTQKTRKLLREAEQLKQAGVLKRAMSGVRQGGRPVNPISQDATARRLAMHNKRNQMAEVSSSTDSVGKLYSDNLSTRKVTVSHKMVGKGVQKRATVAAGGNLFARALDQSVVEPKIRVRLPKTAPVRTQSSAASSASALPRVTINLGRTGNNKMREASIRTAPLNTRTTFPVDVRRRSTQHQQLQRVGIGNRDRLQVIEYEDDESYMESDSLDYVDDDEDFLDDDLQYENDSRESIYNRITM